MGQHMLVRWCQDYSRGRWMSTWDFIEVPAHVRNRVFEFVDAVAGTHAS